MAIKTNHKKRGSTFSLIFMLVVLIALVAAIIFWPVDGATASSGVYTTAQDDIESTTLIHAGDVAPDFTVEALKGGEVTLSEFKGLQMGLYLLQMSFVMLVHQYEVVVEHLLYLLHKLFLLH